MDEFRRSVRPDRVSELPTTDHPVQSVPEIRKKAIQVVDDALGSLLSIYSTAGYSQGEMSAYLLEFSQQLSNTCNSEIAKENEILDLGNKEIEKFQAEIRSLLVTLDRKDSPSFIHLPSENYNHQINSLRDQLETLLHEKQEKLQDIQFKRSKVVEFADELGEVVDFEFEAEDISDAAFAHIDTLRNYYMELKSRRRRKVLQIFHECYKVYQELALFQEGFDCVQRDPCHQRIDETVIAYCERDVEPSMNVLHAYEIGAIEERWSILIHEKESRRNELAALGERIAKLWNHLRVDDCERLAFQQSFAMNLSLKTISTGNDELLRLRRLRAASLLRHVSEVRRSILRLWEESGLSEAVRITDFPAFFQPAEEVDDDMVRFARVLLQLAVLIRLPVGGA